MRRVSLLVWGLGIVAAAPARADVEGTITQLSTATAAHIQDAPAISGTRVVWTDTERLPSGATNQDIYFLDVAAPAAARNLSATPNEQEFLEDIDATSVVWTHVYPGAAGDLVLYDLTSNLATTIASSLGSPVSFSEPSIGGSTIAFVRTDATQLDVFAYDYVTGGLARVTNDAALQRQPRVGGDWIVYTDYTSGNADVLAWRISTRGPSIPVATGAAAQAWPDTDGHWAVWLEDVATATPGLYAYDLETGTRRVLSSTASHKLQPRISNGRVVWADDRNGDFDIYTYDFATAREERLVGGTGDQFLTDTDGNRVVYTSNELGSGLDEVFLFTIAAAPPPPVVPAGCDPARTDLVGQAVTMTQTGHRPVYASGTYRPEPNRNYFVCVENGKPDGSQRTAQFLFGDDFRLVLTPASFRPADDPPRWVAAPLCHKRHHRGGADHADHDDDDDHNCGCDVRRGRNVWAAALFGRAPPHQVTVSIRVAR